MWVLLLATVIRVIDGDTLQVRDRGQLVTVRVLGIDCPESRRNAKCKRGGAAACEAEVPHGKAATLRARELLPAGTEIALRSVGKHDKYGRTLAALRLPGGGDYGEIMVKEGWCAVYEGPERRKRILWK